MKFKIIAIVLFLISSQAFGAGRVSVLILSKHHLKEIELKNDREKVSVRLHKKRLKAGKIVCSDFTFEGTPYLQIEFKDGISESRIYTGSISIRAKDDELRIVNWTDAEDYIHSAALAEIAPLIANSHERWRDELVKAQEVAIRSYLMSGKNRHGDADYCDLTHCTHFPGVNRKDRISLSRGEVILSERGDILPAYFHSTCGGSLSSPEKYWRGHLAIGKFRVGSDDDSSFSFFKGEDILCKKSPHYRWSAFVKEDVMNSIVKSDVIRISLLKADGRVSLLRFSGKSDRDVEMTAADFLSVAGRALGWNVLKSNSFDVRRTQAGWHFTGHGLGHGIGMCQWGASTLAKRGYTYREILDFYYNKPLYRRIER